MENGLTHDNLTKNDVQIVVPLKHLIILKRYYCCIKMEPIKIINLPEKTFNNEDLPKKKVNKKNNNKEIRIEKPILSISFNYDFIV